jgi:hypothetical protein
MLEADPECFPKAAVPRYVIPLQDRFDPTSDSVLIIQNLSQGRPFIWNFTVGVAVLRVVYVGINPTLENLSIVLWFCRGATKSPCQMNV